MPLITVDIPQSLLDLYNTRRATWNAAHAAAGQRPMPPATRATLERLVRDYMKGWIRAEGWRLDPGDGSISDADEAAIVGL